MDPSELHASIEAAKAGRPEGYQALLDEYNPRLFGYFYRMTGNRHDAEDLLGDVVLRLVKTLPNYDERGRFEPWLFRIAANLVRDRFRRLKAGPTMVSLAGGNEDDPDPLNSLPGPSTSVDAALLADEAGEQVNAALKTLDASTRNMIVLRHFAQMSFAQIAEVMDCPIGTALAKVHRGLKTLRKRLNAPAGAARPKTR